MRINFARLQELDPALTNAEQIITEGYANWVDRQVGIGLTNGLYRFTARFEEAPQEPTWLYVGDSSVCVTNAGQYAFVLEKGRSYSFGTRPHLESVQYSYDDDLQGLSGASRAVVAWNGEGCWTLGGGDVLFSLPTILDPGEIRFMPTLVGFPDIAHIGPGDGPVTFSAILADITAGVGADEFRWTAGSDLALSSATGDSIQVCEGELPSWREARLNVSTRVLGVELTSSLSFSYGVNDCPQVSCQVLGHHSVFVNDDGDVNAPGKDYDMPGRHMDDDDILPVTVEMHSDVVTNGTIVIRALIRDGWMWKDEDRTEGVVFEDVIEVTGVSDFLKTYYLEAGFESYGYRTDEIQVFWRDGVENSVKAVHNFTAIDCIAEPITSECVTIGASEYIVNPCCAIIGESSYMKIHVYPEDLPDEKIVWRVVEGIASFPRGNTGRLVEIVAGGAVGDEIVLEVDIDDCPGRRPRFELQAERMTEVLIYPYLIAGAPGADLTQAQLAEKLLVVNKIYRQVGLHFSAEPLETINNFRWSDLGLAKRSVGKDIRNYMHKTDGVEVYFIGGEGGLVDYDRPALGRANSDGVVVCCRASGRVLAHEIGHVCRLADVYTDETIPEQHAALRQAWMMRDWSNGTGSRFYATGKCPLDVLPNILMYGTENDRHLDIPTGSVRGLVENRTTHIKSMGNAAVGRSTMIVFPPHTK